MQLMPAVPLWKDQRRQAERWGMGLPWQRAGAHMTSKRRGLQGGAEGEQGEMGSADTAPVPHGEPGQSGLQGEAAAPVSAERSDNSSIAQCRCALLFASAAVHTGIDVHHTPKKTNRISEINLCFVLYEGKKSQQISTATNAAIHAAIA